MDGRLSEHALRARLDAGHQSIPWQVPKPAGFLAGIDFDAILASPDAKKIIRALPVQPLYYGLKRRGMMECADVLKLLSQDQVTRVFDFDIWSRDELSRAKAFALLKAFAAGGSKQLCKRFVALDEEYQLSILEGMLRVYTEEEFEVLADSKQDELYAMPCNKIFYEILAEDNELTTAIAQLLAAIIEHHLSYAYALISHVSYHPPAEAMQQLKQFRQARLEEEGFVTYEESLEVFLPFDRQILQDKYRSSVFEARRQGAVAHPVADGQVFLDLVLAHARDIDLDIDLQYEIHQGFLFLANSLCSAAQVEPEDVYGLNRVLEQAKALISLALEFLSSSDVVTALAILKAEHAKTLFRLGLSLVDDLRTLIIGQLTDVAILGVDLLADHYRGRRWGAILSVFDRQMGEILGFYHCEVLKGLFNRFPMAPSLSADGKSVQFVPIAELSILSKISNQAAGILAFVRLCDRMRLAAIDQDIERLVSSGMLHYCVKKRFELVPDRQCLKAFQLLSEEQVRVAVSELLEELLFEQQGELFAAVQSCEFAAIETVRQQLMQLCWQIAQRLIDARHRDDDLQALAPLAGESYD